MRPYRKYSTIMSKATTAWIISALQSGVLYMAILFTFGSIKANCQNTYISGLSWSNSDSHDYNGNGFPCCRVLNIDADSTDTTSTVMATVSVYPSFAADDPPIHVYNSDPVSVGKTAGDGVIQVRVGADMTAPYGTNGFDNGFYNFRVELYENGISQPVDQQNESTSSLLASQKFERSIEDTGVATVLSTRWSSLIDADDDYFLESAILNITINVPHGSTWVSAQVNCWKSGNSASDTPDGSFASDMRLLGGTPSNVSENIIPVPVYGLKRDPNDESYEFKVTLVQHGSLLTTTHHVLENKQFEEDFVYIALDENERHEIWWSDILEYDQDNYSCNRILNIDTNSAAGPTSVHAKVFAWPEDGNSWQRVYQSETVEVGKAVGDGLIQIPVGADMTKLDGNEGLEHGYYDFRIELYQDGIGQWVDEADWESNVQGETHDNILKDEKFETSFQDIGPGQMASIAWLQESDIDHDNYLESAIMNVNVYVPHGATWFQAKISPYYWENGYKHLISPVYSEAFFLGTPEAGGTGNTISTNINGLDVLGAYHMNNGDDDDGKFLAFNIDLIQHGYEPSAENNYEGFVDTLEGLPGKDFEKLGFTAGIANVEWPHADTLDYDNDGYSCRRILSIEPAITAGRATVRAKVSYAHSGGTLTSLFQSDPITVGGEETGARINVPIGADMSKFDTDGGLEHGYFDFQVELYQSDVFGPVHTVNWNSGILDNAGNNTLADEKFETSLQDTGVAEIDSIFWTNKTDFDHDNYPESATLNITVDIPNGATWFRAKITPFYWENGYNHFASPIYTDPVFLGGFQNGGSGNVIQERMISQEHLPLDEGQQHHFNFRVELFQHGSVGRVDHREDPEMGFEKIIYEAYIESVMWDPKTNFDNDEYACNGNFVIDVDSKIQHVGTSVKMYWRKSENNLGGWSLLYRSVPFMVSGVSTNDTFNIPVGAKLNSATDFSGFEQGAYDFKIELYSAEGNKLDEKGPLSYEFDDLDDIKLEQSFEDAGTLTLAQQPIWTNPTDADNDTYPESRELIIIPSSPMTGNPDTAIPYVWAWAKIYQRVDAAWNFFLSTEPVKITAQNAENRIETLVRGIDMGITERGWFDFRIDLYQQGKDLPTDSCEAPSAKFDPYGCVPFLESVRWNADAAIDYDDDAFPQKRRLIIDATIESGNADVLAKILVESTNTMDPPWSYTTVPITIAESSRENSFEIDLGYPRQSFSHGKYNVTVQLYQNELNQGLFRGQQCLSLVQFEKSCEDTGYASVSKISWAPQRTDADSDGYDSARILVADLDIPHGISEVQTKLYCRVLGSATPWTWYSTTGWQPVSEDSPNEIVIQVGKLSIHDRDPAELPFGTYDFEIRFYQSDTGLLSTVIRNGQVEPDLDNQNFETIEQDTSPVQSVSTPMITAYPNEAEIGEIITVSAEADSDAFRESPEYRFDWGDGTVSEWGPGTQYHSYSAPASYRVAAQARGIFSEETSQFSASHIINVSSASLLAEREIQWHNTIPYCPSNGTVEVRITFDCNQDNQFTSMTLDEYIPEGWEFNSLVQGSPDLYPMAGKTELLSFSWNSIPLLPYVLSYRLNVPGQATGLESFSGIVNCSHDLNETTTSFAVDDASNTVFEIPFKNGWNLISIPFTAEQSNINDFTGRSAFWTWDAQNQAYVQTSEPIVGEAYWCHASDTNQRDDLSIWLRGQPNAAPAITVKKGWNLVGLTGDPIHEAMSLPQDKIVLKPAWSWNGSSYQQESTWQFGRGYWFFATEDGEIRLSW